MGYYPVNIDVTDRLCVVIGGGEVAERKIRGLLDAGARIRVVAPQVSDGIRGMAVDGIVELIESPYEPKALDGALLVIAATDDGEANAAVSDDAKSSGILANSVDDPDHCAFIVPSTIRRGDLIVTVSTSGKSPTLARMVRETIESHVGPVYGELAALLGEIRDEVKAAVDGMDGRMRVYARIVESDEIKALLASGRMDEALRKARECIW